jgi:tRNA (Thr-GGU) A37 N-methylase
VFAPNYTVTPAIAADLMVIEAARAVIEVSPIDVEMLAGLRRTSRLQATYYFKQIEGNRLTQVQVDEVLEG